MTNIGPCRFKAKILSLKGRVLIGDWEIMKKGYSSKDEIIYELSVRAFCASDGDGIGDFRGLTSKVQYLQSLGITTLLLQRFFLSPLRDCGYDISDFTGAMFPISLHWGHTDFIG
jgi:hypothetical protein